jgi:aspartyl-tRNA(Asn)/glutamyl-tRNA(Gln) amidotransferase subunit A
MPDEPEALGLLALMLLADARRPARPDADGQLVPLAEQDRTRWDRTLIAEDFRNVFASGVDLLFTPTTPTPAFPIGAKAADPYEMYLSDIFTVTANLTGVPAMSVPIGRVDGLPVGGQLLAPHFHEPDLFAAGYCLERALGDEAHR